MKPTSDSKQCATTPTPSLYRIVSIIFALALTYWYLVAGVMGNAGFGASLWLPSSYNEILAVYWTFLLLLVQLPSAIIAWNEPDPLPNL